MHRMRLIVGALCALSFVTATALAKDTNGVIVPGWEFPGAEGMKPNSANQLTHLEVRHCQDLAKGANGAMIRRQRGQEAGDALDEMLALIPQTSITPDQLRNILNSAYQEKRYFRNHDRQVAIYQFRTLVFGRCLRRGYRQ